MNYFYKNKIRIEYCSHEGLVLSSELILEIFNEYKINKLYENSVYENYVMEEIFIPSYILNKYNVSKLNTFCFIYKYTLTNPTYTQIINNLKDEHVSIKPVNRCINDSLRKIINNLDMK